MSEEKEELLRWAAMVEERVFLHSAAGIVTRPRAAPHCFIDERSDSRDTPPLDTL